MTIPALGWWMVATSVAAEGWGDARWLMALWAVPVLGALMWAGWGGRRSAARAITPRAKPSAGVALARGALTLASLASVSIALARPRANPREEGVPQTGRDLVFLVDVSRSMLARDLSPSRLGKAKLWIGDLVDQLRGDRVALVAFAGSSSIACPLTLDYPFFRMALAELSPESVARGGTLIGDALRKVGTDVLTEEGRPVDLVLITDGEDQESFPVEAARELGRRGVRIIAIGVGSELEGASVPTREGASDIVEYRGEAVKSRMNGSVLREVAQATPGGAYLGVGTGTIALDRVYRDLAASAEKARTGTLATIRYEERFPWFLGAAVVLLLADTLLAVGWTRGKEGRAHAA